MYKILAFLLIYNYRTNTRAYVTYNSIFDIVLFYILYCNTIRLYVRSRILSAFNFNKDKYSYLHFEYKQLKREKMRLHLAYYTAKTQYRKFETNIPRKGTGQPQAQFLHSCFCERFIYSHDQSAYSAARK
jgi:hypothetical protein